MSAGFPKGLCNARLLSAGCSNALCTAWHVLPDAVTFGLWLLGAVTRYVMFVLCLLGAVTRYVTLSVWLLGTVTRFVTLGLG